MPAPEALRNQIYTDLSAQFSDETTEALMSMLPFDDKLATKGDIALLKSDIDALEVRLVDKMEARGRSTNRSILLLAIAMIGAVSSLHFIP